MATWPTGAVVLNVTALSGIGERTDAPGKQHQRLAHDLKNMQDCYDASRAGRDDVISKMANEISSLYRGSSRALTTRYVNLMCENQVLSTIPDAEKKREKCACGSLQAASGSKVLSQRISSPVKRRAAERAEHGA